MRRAVAGTLLALPLVAGCVYLNSLYNARHRFADGERDRFAGRVDEARQAYEDAIRKAAHGYRMEPDGPWADDALYVLGRAYLRTGDFERARRALEESLARADDAGVRQGARLFLGVALLQGGEPSRALPLLNEALRVLPDGPLAAEGHLWRARLLLGQGLVDQGWWDLDRAVALDSRLAAASHLERLAWGVLRNDRARAREGAVALLADADGAARADSLEASVRRAARKWGPSVAAELLATGRGGRWPPGPRDRILLLRTELLVEAGDSLAAETEAGWVAGGVGDGATRARLLLASIRLRRAREVAELAGARRVLLPAAGRPSIRALAEAIRTVELLDEWGGAGEPEALFAAAELARDALGAPVLARSLFLRYAAEAPDRPWATKALLAALGTTPDPRSDDAVRGRLARRARDPYVQAATKGYVEALTLNGLEARLREIVRDLVTRARDEARRRDVRLRGDTALVQSRSGPTLGPMGEM